MAYKADFRPGRGLRSVPAAWLNSIANALNTLQVVFRPGIGVPVVEKPEHPSGNRPYRIVLPAPAGGGGGGGGDGRHYVALPKLVNRAAAGYPAEWHEVHVLYEVTPPASEGGAWGKTPVPGPNDIGGGKKGVILSDIAAVTHSADHTEGVL